jgi:hypothetical protein
VICGLQKSRKPPATPRAHYAQVPKEQGKDKGMRIFTRLGVALVAVTALVSTAGVAAADVASAAAGTYKVNVNHSSGTLATSSQGNLTWSTSRRTVTISNASFYIKAGEWADVTWQGYQGNKLVHGGFWDAQDRRLDTGTTVSYAPMSMSVDIPGGIEFVRIRVRDIYHEITSLKDCYYYMTTC